MVITNMLTLKLNKLVSIFLFYNLDIHSLLVLNKLLYEINNFKSDHNYYNNNSKEVNNCGSFFINEFLMR